MRVGAELKRLEVEAALKQRELELLRRYETDVNAALTLRELEERQAAKLQKLDGRQMKRGHTTAKVAPLVLKLHAIGERNGKSCQQFHL